MNLHQTRELLTTLIAVVVSVIYIATASLFFARLKTRRREQRSRFYAALQRGFSNGAIESVDDLVNVYKGIFGLSGEDTSYKAELARHLRQQLASLAIGELPLNGGAESSIDAAQKRKITEFVKMIEAESPFAGLPSAERSYLQDAREFIRVGNEEQALRKLDGLGGLIEVRQDTLEKV